jgi:hypothetical protein
MIVKYYRVSTVRFLIFGKRMANDGKGSYRPFIIGVPFSGEGATVRCQFIGI